MKPRFAISFTDDGLALLHRERRGWVEIGQTDFDTPDLPQAMDWLRSTAQGLAPEGVTTTLVIPKSQILYTDLPLRAADTVGRQAEIAAALEGRTPYDVSELVFDHIVKDKVAQVAVVARETLAEAEGFAAQFGLNPVSFTAVPPEGRFDGVPFFGASSIAPSLLVAGQSIKRETRAVVAGRRNLPVADTVDTPVAAAQEEPVAEPAPDLPAPDLPVAPEPVPVLPEPLPEPMPEPLPEPEPEPEPAPEIIPEPEPEPDFPMPEEVPAFDPIPVPVTAAVLGRRDEVDEAPMALDVTPEPEAIAPRSFDLDIGAEKDVSTDTAGPAVTEPPAAVLASLGFASRRTVEASLPTPSPAPAPKPAAPRSEPIPRPAPVLAKQPSAVAPAVPAHSPAARLSAPVRDIPGAAPRPALDPKKAKVTLGTIPIRRTEKPAEKLADKAADPTAAAAAVAKPAEFKPRARPIQRGKPRYLGLILTGMLLVFLALAAVLSKVYIASNEAESPAPEATVAEVAPEQAVPVEPAPTTEVAAADPAPAVMPPAAAPQAEDQVAPATDVATDAATVAADADRQDEIILSSADQAPQASDASALPMPQAQGDPPPATLADPPPFGTVYQFDENGLIKPTPEGILTPEGVLLLAGRPPIEPPARPADLAPAAQAAAPAEGTVDTPAATFPADPALAGARPRARPADLAPPPPAPEDAANAEPAVPAADPKLRPAPRPAAILAAGQAAQQNAVQAASLASAALADPNRSVLAISVSRRPAARPADMTIAVAAAVAAAARQPEPEPMPEAAVQAAPQAAADPAPEEAAEAADAEPEDTAMPTVPTRASVAKQATVANVLNLSKVSLIGIYGTPSNRSALVRQPNGRYVKVAIGDRVDGGRVAAITDTELRYQKGGRMLVLTMPRT